MHNVQFENGANRRRRCSTMTGSGASTAVEGCTQLLIACSKVKRA